MAEFEELDSLTVTKESENMQRVELHFKDEDEAVSISISYSASFVVKYINVHRSIKEFQVDPLSLIVCLLKQQKFNYK